MKSLKLGTLVVASLFAINSFAQTKAERKTKAERTEMKTERMNMTPEEKARKQTDKMNEKLGLSDDQNSKIYEINLGVNMKNAAVRTNETFSKEQKMEAIKGNNDGRKYLIRETLNDEQKAKFDAMKEKHEAHKAEMMEKRGSKKGKKAAPVEEDLEDEGL